MQEKKRRQAEMRARDLRPGSYIYLGRLRTVVDLTRFWRNGRVIGGWVHLPPDARAMGAGRVTACELEILDFALKARRITPRVRS